MQYHWPGNIRELESTVSRAALSSPGRVIRPADIEFLHAERDARRSPPASACRRSPKPSARTSSASSRACSWNKKQAAAVLEISRGTLYRKIVEYGLEADPKASRNRTR